jgi:hypothetical protein
VAETTVAEVTVAEVMAELAALEDPKIHEVNEKHGDHHGVNLGKLRARQAPEDPAGPRTPALGNGRQRGETAGAPDLPPEGVRA